MAPPGDTLIHVEKYSPSQLSPSDISAFATELTGLETPRPLKALTGCDKRRNWLMISQVPEEVTCAACRQYARGELLLLAASIDTLLGLREVRRYIPPGVSEADLAAEAARDREMAARYA